MTRIHNVYIWVELNARSIDVQSSVATSLFGYVRTKFIVLFIMNKFTCIVDCQWVNTAELLLFFSFFTLCKRALSFTTRVNTSHV